MAGTVAIGLQDFGKTLTMSMVEQFFSVEYAGNENFQGLEIWKEDGYRKMQGTYPVISLSLSSVKEKSYEEARKKQNSDRFLPQCRSMRRR